MKTVTWLTDVLRGAGLPVVEHDGWKTRGAGQFTDVTAVVWHHDASAKGYSPNMAAYEVREVSAGRPGANIWVGLDGTWHLIAAEVTYHAGKVLAGKPDNHHSIGVETDHTTGETWSGVDLLDSLRRGTAAILAHLGRSADGLHFHKTICAPVGRKNDPDGLDLATERRAVDAIAHPPAPKEDMLMRDERIITIPAPDDEGRQLVNVDKGGAHLGRFSQTSSVVVCASREGRPTDINVQPFSYGDALVLSITARDGSPAPAGTEARIVIEHR